MDIGWTNGMLDHKKLCLRPQNTGEHVGLRTGRAEGAARIRAERAAAAEHGRAARVGAERRAAAERARARAGAERAPAEHRRARVRAKAWTSNGKLTQLLKLRPRFLGCYWVLGRK